MKAKLLKVLDKIIWILKLFVTTNFQKKINASIPIDKQRHAVVCLMGVIGLSPVLMIVFPIWIAIGVAIIAVSLFGAAYEFYQKYSKKGQFDLKDILADVIGAIAGGVIISIVVLVLKAAEIIN
jgi:VanZ family protein